MEPDIGRGGTGGGEGRASRAHARRRSGITSKNGGVPVPPPLSRRGESGGERDAGTLHIFEVRRYK